MFQGKVLVRDSKRADAAVLSFPPHAWCTALPLFLAGAQHGTEP